MSESTFKHGLVNAIMHQCSKCRYTSPRKDNVQTHVKSCPGGTVLSEKSTLLSMPENSFGPDDMLNVTINNNGRTNIINTTNIINGNVINNNNNAAAAVTRVPKKIQPYNKDILQRELSILFDNKEFVKILLANLNSLERMPALVFNKLKGPSAPPSKQNVRVNGNTVTLLGGNGTTMSRGKFIKQFLGDITDGMVRTSKEKMWEDGDMNRLFTAWTNPKYTCGKKNDISPYDVIQYYSVSAPSTYRIDKGGREFLDDTKSIMDDTLRSL